ncbi:alpha/beta-hydrolase family protein [Pararhizobium sp. A13]|uniref:alpha/beta hydrolase n=1 Tax=Pararhizobium sp. A13 TaxID=3133975 RepID=UPI00324F64E3
MRNSLLRLWTSLSTPGLLVGILFFAASLTPSLIPRPYPMQGVLSGCSLAAGYGLGVFGRWLWFYLELPGVMPDVERGVKAAALLVAGATAIAFLWQASRWQNSVRSLMGLEPVQTAEPVELAIIAFFVFLLFVALARLFAMTFAFLSRKLERVTPKPVARVLGILLAFALFWSIADGVLFKAALRLADSSFRELDALIDSDLAPPADPSKTGSTASLIPWGDLGFRGREFVASGPTGEKIGTFLRQPALEPIRVYVGLNAAKTAKERAALALAELKRVGAFERSILIVVVPTGTGWVDPAAMDTVEYLHRGDVASVALQYSYLTSWLSLLVEPSYGAEAGEALFRQVYDHWTTLPKDKRPKLYLHGLSLGALNSERSADLFDVIGDPFQGALWSGPPFESAGWRSVTAGRDPGSPAWLPRFRDSSVIRFTAQKNALDISGAQWGPMRIVYLQYASDPVTFFDFHALYREPDWMKQPRGLDVSPDLTWYPVVTMLQLALDMAMATTSPMGYGHVYAPEHYVDAWMAVTDPQGLAPGDVDRLKAMVSKRD